MAMKLERACAACGAQGVGGQFCETCGAEQEALSFERDKARLRHARPLRSARSSLIWVGILTAFGHLVLFGQSGGSDVLGLMIGIGLAALYLGLWQWSKQQPLGATAAGLGIYVTLLVGNALVDPFTLARGVIFKVIILVVLIRGVRAGVILRSHGVSGL